MPWVTPTLAALRALNRDNVTAQLRSGPLVPNSVTRVLADANAGMAYLVLLYLDWLSKQLLPDTAEHEWLDRHAAIWLTNVDSSNGRKVATFAVGTIDVIGLPGIVLPNGSQFLVGEFLFQTTAEITVGSDPSPAPFVAITAGHSGIELGTTAALVSSVSGITSASISSLDDGVAEESDDELRIRVLDRIREPPMGGDAFDYVQWALNVPGVTRAWSAPNEQGMGTIIVRIMCDDLRAAGGGFPEAADLAAATAYLDTKRPVTTKDFWVLGPIPEPIDFTISNLVPDDGSTRAAIIASVKAMLELRARPASSLNGVLIPAQDIYAAWVSEAILSASGVVSFDLTMTDHVMPYNGAMAVLGTVVYA